MKKAAFCFSFIISLGISGIYAAGEMDMLSGEQQRRLELMHYGMEVSTLSFPAAAIYDFIYTTSGMVVYVNPMQLVEADPYTGEQRVIAMPEGWARRRFEGFRDLQYDAVDNSVHMLFMERGASSTGGPGFSYHILHLDDYTWTSIDELGSDIIFSWYDEENKHIYVYQQEFRSLEADQNLPLMRRLIIKYDLNTRETLDLIDLPPELRNVTAIYGSPVRVLGESRIVNEQYIPHYVVFDLDSRETFIFQDNLTMEERIYGNSIIDNFSLGYFINADNGMSFLAVESGNSISRIIFLDFYSKSRETIALDNFPFSIYSFKKIASGKYGFMVGTRTWWGGYGPSFLCFLEIITDNEL